MSIFEDIAEDFDPAILLPNRYSAKLRMWFIMCPCGRAAGQHGGFLAAHFKPQRPIPGHPGQFTGGLCDRSGTAVTLAAALARDERKTKAESWVAGNVHRVQADTNAPRWLEDEGRWSDEQR